MLRLKGVHCFRERYNLLKPMLQAINKSDWYTNIMSDKMQQKLEKKQFFVAKYFLNPASSDSCSYFFQF